MPVITTSQESSWDSNVYVVVTTRIFVLMGTAYLVLNSLTQQHTSGCHSLHLLHRN